MGEHGVAGGGAYGVPVRGLHAHTARCPGTGTSAVSTGLLAAWRKRDSALCSYNRQVLYLVQYTRDVVHARSS